MRPTGGAVITRRGIRRNRGGVVGRLGAMVKIVPPRNHSKTKEWRTFHTSKALAEKSTRQRWRKLSYLKLEEYPGGGNVGIPRYNRGKAGAMLVELALVYIIWERSHMRVTGDRDGSPPRCTETTERMTVSGLTAKN